MKTTYKVMLTILLFSVFLFSIFYLPSKTKYPIPEQLNSQAELSSIYSTSKQCDITDNLLIATAESISGKTEYILRIIDSDKYIRLFKTHFVLGGFKFEGTSHDGEYSVLVSVNYLSDSGTDVLIEKLDHFSDGTIIADAYSFCTF